MDSISDSALVLVQLVKNGEFFKKAIPHLKEEYFEEVVEQKLFRFVKNYSAKYKEAPDILLIKNIVPKLNASNDQQLYVDQLVNEIHVATPLPFNVILDKAEEWIKDRALHCAIVRSMSIYAGTDELSDTAIPSIMKDALSVTLNSTLYGDYFDQVNVETRWAKYHDQSIKVPFTLKALNEVTNNGVGIQELHCIVAGPNVGKSSLMISLAAEYIESGVDVLYISCEMSEHQVSQRFDSRFLKYRTKDIPNMDEDLYFGKFEKLRQRAGRGKLVIETYSPNELTAHKLDILLDEYETKMDYKPKVIFIDYIGICSSALLKDRGNLGIYYTKVAEEFRAVSMQRDLIMWTAQQMTTDSMNSTDPTLRDIGLGQGIAKTSGLVWFAIRTEELDALKQIMIKQDKTRYHEERVQRFILGYDFKNMMLYDVDQSAAPISETSNKDHVKAITTPFNKGQSRSTGFKKIKV